jgi:outer membrane protein assembly factor BamD
LHPNHPNVDYAYYLKGLANFNDDLGLLGNLVDQDMSERDPRAARDAFLAFKELVTRFPDSKYAADSTARMKYLVNALAAQRSPRRQVLPQAQAWVAAANRAKEVLKTYPEAPALEEALAIMVVSYDKLEAHRPARRRPARADAELPQQPFAKGVSTETKRWYRFW